MATPLGPGAAGAPMTPEELAAFNEFNNTTLRGREYWAKNPVTGEPGAWYWLGTMGWLNAAPDIKTLSGGHLLDPYNTDKYWWKDPNTSWSLAGRYGTNPNEKVNPDAGMANPDWEGGQQGKPVGRLGGTSGMGQMIYYNAPQTWKATKQGQLIETPMGNYKAYYNTSLGQWILHGQEGAVTGGLSPFLYGYTGQEGHLGINPFTGEIWYQSVKNAPKANWGKVDEDYDPLAGTDRSTSSSTASQQTSSTAGTTGTTGATDTAGTTSTAAATSGITGSMGASAGYSSSTPLSIGFNLPNLTSTTTQGGMDYVAALNNMLITDVMGGMFTGRGRA